MNPLIDLKGATLHWLSNYAQQGVFTTDVNLKITSWNNWMEKHTGFSEEAVIGKPILEIYPNLTTDRFNRYYRNALRGQVGMLSQRFHRSLIPIPLPKDRIRTESFELMQQGAQIAPLLEGHEIVGTITIIEDVTERVIREMELQNRIDTLEELHKIGQTILTLDLRQCLSRIVETTRLLMDVPLAAVILRHGDMLQVSECSGCHLGEMHWKIEENKNIATRIFSSGQVEYMATVPDSERAQLLSKDSRSVMGVPLKTKEKIFGVLLVEAETAEYFNAMHGIQLQRLGVQASIAIQNAQLYDQVRQDATRLKIMIDIDHAVLAAETPQAIAQAALDHMQHLLPYYSGQIISFDLDTNTPQLLAIYGEEREKLSKPEKYVLQQLGADAENIERIVDIALFKSRWPGMVEHFSPPDAQSVIFVPLLTRDRDEDNQTITVRLIGIIMIWAKMADAFNDIHLQITNNIADSLAVAIYQAQLFLRMRRLATVDSLTQLWNRHEFFQLARYEFERSERYKRPLTAIMLDIDWFKQVNDTFGHAVGDDVLKMVAAACETCIRNVDILGRYGGEEFAVLLPETNLHQGVLTAERLRKAVMELKVPLTAGLRQTVLDELTVKMMRHELDIPGWLKRLEHLDHLAISEAQWALLERGEVGFAEWLHEILDNQPAEMSLRTAKQRQDNVVKWEGRVNQLQVYYGRVEMDSDSCRNLVSRLFEYIPITISLGVSEIKEEMNISGLIAEADMALYDAKMGGRNQVVVR